MAETTGLLNRRTGHSVPRVRISSSPQPCNSPALLAPGCFGMRRTRARSWTTYTKTARTTVRSWAVAWLPGPPWAARDAASAAPRNLVHPHIVLSPNSRTSAPPMDIQNAPPRAPRADIGQWRTATTRTAHGSGISVRLFDEERYRGLLSRSS